MAEGTHVTSPAQRPPGWAVDADAAYCRALQRAATEVRQRLSQYANSPRFRWKLGSRGLADVGSAKI